jgi:hypothetical protein
VEGLWYAAGLGGAGLRKGKMGLNEEGNLGIIDFAVFLRVWVIGVRWQCGVVSQC